MTKVVIVDYGMGNLLSVAGALRRAGGTVVVSGDPEALADADRIVLPGVGAFGDGIRNLRARGFEEALTEHVLRCGTPFLGICLGAQLLALESEEEGRHEGLGWLPARVVRLAPRDPALRLPHIGWDEVEVKISSPLFEGLPTGTLFYFVHNYHLRCDEEGLLSAVSDYGERVTAALQKDNIYAVQFHPEKSQKAGLDLLRNFLERTA